MSPERSPAEAFLRTGNRIGRNDDVGAQLDHRMQDLLESEASAGTRKWPVKKSLTLVAFVSVGLWALIFTAYQAIF